MEYLSDFDEKLMVKEVNICSFRGVWRNFDELVVKGLRRGHEQKIRILTLKLKTFLETEKCLETQEES